MAKCGLAASYYCELIRTVVDRLTDIFRLSFGFEKVNLSPVGIEVISQHADP